MNSSCIFRIDKFRVPDAARDEFLARTQEADRLLRRLPGFIEHRLLHQTGGPGRFNFVTIAIWRDAQAVAAARVAVAARYRASGFDPQAMFARLNIEADLAHYEEIAA